MVMVPKLRRVQWVAAFSTNEEKFKCKVLVRKSSREDNVKKKMYNAAERMDLVAYKFHWWLSYEVGIIQLASRISHYLISGRILVYANN
jgi:hypothetical protein